jgi:hypothetical protein
MKDIETTEPVEVVESAPEAVEAPKSAREAVEQAETAEQKAQAVFDLESASKVKWDGKEYTPKELRDMFMMKSDYTKKTQELSQKEKSWGEKEKTWESESKFQTNLSADLAAVKSNPELTAQFKAIYPEKYHAYLGLVTEAEKKAEMQALPPEIQAKLAKMDELEKKLTGIESTFDEQKAAAINAELDATFKPLAEKYPYADEEQVIARAQAILDKDPKATLTAETWDNLFKLAHERVENLVKTKQSQSVEKQKQANNQASGPAPGGQTPMQAPKKFGSLREAFDAAKAQL